MNTDIINNTIASNDSTASSGVLFNTLGAPLAGNHGPTCTANCGTASAPQPAGLVSVQNSAVLVASLPASITCPAGHFSGTTAANGTCRRVSYPKLENNVVWKNRSFYIGVGALGGGTLNQQNVVTLYDAFTTTAAPSQPTATHHRQWQRHHRHRRCGRGVSPVGYWIGQSDTGPTNTIQSLSTPLPVRPAPPVTAPNTGSIRRS